MGAAELRRHRCSGRPEKGDSSRHWDLVSSDEGLPQWPFNEGFPTDCFAKCELILRDKRRVTAWIQTIGEDWRWKTFKDPVNTCDVAAWKVVEHFA